MSEETEALAERLRREVKERNKEPDYFDQGVTQDMSDAADAIELLASSQARLSEAVKVLEEAKTWHEEQDKALSKQPQTHGPSGNQWARLQHREQIDILQAFLATLGEENEA